MTLAFAMHQEQPDEGWRRLPGDENDIGAWMAYFEGLTARELVLYIYAATRAATM